MMTKTEELIAECKRLSDIVLQDPTSKNLSLLYKAIKKAKEHQKTQEDILKTKREIMKLEMRLRKTRTHNLIVLGAEYFRVFQDYDFDKARARFEQLQKSELEQLLNPQQEAEHKQESQRKKKNAEP